MRAELYAGIALNALSAVPDHSTVITDAECACRAVRNAYSAAAAHVNGFRIMAEHAVECASLKEDGGPVARTVHV